MTQKLRYLTEFACFDIVKHVKKKKKKKKKNLTKQKGKKRIELCRIFSIWSD